MGEETLSGKKRFVSDKNVCSKIHDYVRTAVKVISWESPYKVWVHIHILLVLKAGDYEVGKRRVRMTKFSVSPDIHKSVRKSSLYFCSVNVC